MRHVALPVSVLWEVPGTDVHGSAPVRSRDQRSRARTSRLICPSCPFPCFRCRCCHCRCPYRIRSPAVGRHGSDQSTEIRSALKSEAHVYRTSRRHAHPAFAQGHTLGWGPSSFSRRLQEACDTMAGHARRSSIGSHASCGALPCRLLHEVSEAWPARRRRAGGAQADSAHLSRARHRDSTMARASGSRPSAAEHPAALVSEPRDAGGQREDVASLVDGLPPAAEDVLGTSSVGSWLLRGE